MRNIFALAMLLVFLSSGVAFAEVKIGVFDTKTVFTQSDVLKQAQADIEKAYGAQKTEIEKKRAELEKLAASMGEKPSDSQKKTFTTKQNEYNTMANEYMRAMQAAELQVRDAMEQVAETAAAEVAKSKKLDIVMDSVSVFYVDKKLDVTKEMLAAINKAWKEAQKK